MIKLHTIFALLFTFNVIAQSIPGEIPEECQEGADPQSSYYGNWDLHVGDCWQPPEPKTCAVCNYM